MSWLLSTWENYLVANTMAAIIRDVLSMYVHYTMYIVHAGMDAEGIYRISGKTNDILRIKKEFDNSESVNIHSLAFRLVSVW